jgi:trimethylamine--corrinoid protein Co-methyltransferase
LTEARVRETVPAKVIEGSVMARATGGRAGRHLRRSKALPINPAPPGGFGGQYKPLSMSDMEQIYDVALRLLEELGVGEAPDRLRDLFV